MTKIVKYSYYLSFNYTTRDVLKFFFFFKSFLSLLFLLRSLFSLWWFKKTFKKKKKKTISPSSVHLPSNSYILFLFKKFTC
jgi:hypothetical protein